MEKWNKLIISCITLYVVLAILYWVKIISDAESIINMFLTGTLVVVTGFYAYETHRLTELSLVNTQINVIKNQQKIVKDLVQIVLTPLIQQVESTQIFFSKREFPWWHHEEKGYLLRFNILQIDEDIKNCVEKVSEDDRSDIDSLIRDRVFSYNQKIQDLRKNILSVIELICTTEFRQKCIQLAQDIKTIDARRVPYETATYFMDKLLMQKDHFPEKYPPHREFNNVYLRKDEVGEMYTLIIKNKEISKKVKLILKVSDTLEKESKNLLFNLKKIREQLSKKYNISREEYSGKSSLKYLNSIK